MFRPAWFSGAAFLALSACGGAGGTAMSDVPDTEAEKAAVATEIATMMSDPAMMDQMFAPEAVGGMIPDMSAMCAAVPADQAAACTQRMESSTATIQSVQTEMMGKAKAMQPALMQDMGAIMARTYTGEELAAMHAFYQSPEGQAILQKQPQVMAEFMPAVMARMQPLQLEMVQKLSQRMTAAATTPTTAIPGAVVPQAAPLPPGSTVTTTVTPPAPTTPPAALPPAQPRPN